MGDNGERLISIIVPVYQAKDTLKKCVLSCLNQKFSEAYSLEIILVDDGSADGSAAICDELEREYSGDSKEDQGAGPKVTVIHTRNHGVSHARNIGLERVSGKFVAFVDADDQVKEDFLENLLKEADEETVLLDDTDSYVEARKISGFQYIENCILNRDSHVWGKLFDKKTLEDGHIRFREDLTIGEDLLFLLDLALSQEKKHTIRCINKGGYIYMENEAGAMKSAFKASYMDELKCWKQAEEKLLPYQDRLSRYAYVSLAVSQIMTAFLVIGKVAVMEAVSSAGAGNAAGDKGVTFADEDLKRLAVDAASEQIRHGLKTQGAFAALSAGYKLKVMLFRLSPSLYLKLYGKHKGN